MEFPAAYLPSRQGRFQREFFSVRAYAALAGSHAQGYRFGCMAGRALFLAGRRLVFGRNEAAERLAERLLGRAAKHFLGGGIEEGDALAFRNENGLLGRGNTGGT